MAIPRSKRLPLILVCGAALAAVSLAVVESADARTRRGRRPRRFVSAQVPSKGRTPATDASGAPAGASRDVQNAPAGGAASEGGADTPVKDPLQGGTAILLSPTRALVANPWRGLAVVDVSDPDAPVVLGAVAIEGSADRVFADGASALVVSRTWDAAGGRTRITAVDLSDEAHPGVVGAAVLDGDVVDVKQSGGALLVVTTTYGWGPYVDTAGGGRTEPAVAAKSLRAGADPATGGVHAPDFGIPWAGDGKVRVARIETDDDGAPQVVGVEAFAGALLAHAFDGDTLALVADTTVWSWPGGPVYFAEDGEDFDAGGVQLYDFDLSGAPHLDGVLRLEGISGVSTLHVADDVARCVGWTWDGTSRVATYQLGDGAPTALGAADLPVWPESAVFTATRLAYGTTSWATPYGDDGIGKPDGSGGGSVPGDPAGVRTSPRPDPAAPTSQVVAVDLSDPAHPVLGGALDLDGGWGVSLRAAGDDVVASTTSWSEAASSTHFVRIDLADAAKPVAEATADADGAWYPSHEFGDLLLLAGGTFDSKGGWRPQALPLSTEGGGLALGGAFDAGSWISAAAWAPPILAAGSYDVVRLFDLTDLATPKARGTVRLAVNVADLAVLSDDAAACLVTDWVGGDIEVRTVSLPAADALVPLDAVTLGTGDARLFHDGAFLYVLSTDWSTGRGGLTVVDATDPADLRVRGSLDLASYPGQAFLVNGSMVLLREAWSLVETDEATGRKTPKSDEFGRARRSWLGDELSAVLDVVDLSDPDDPKPAVRRRLRWDFGGEAILRGSTLYVPSYSWSGVSPEGVMETAYGIQGIDLTTPSRPRISRRVAVPGSLAAATDTPGRVLTVSYDWAPDAWTFSSTLHLVDLRVADWRGRVVAEAALEGTPGTVVAGADHAYVASESWNAESVTPTSSLRTFSLLDLIETSRAERETSAWGGRIVADHLFLRTWGWTGAIDVYGLDDPSAPAFETSAEVDGIGTTIEVAGGRAYVPAGYRGVAIFPLAD